MNLSNRCVNNFTSITRRRGDDYFKDGRVSLKTMTATTSEFEVVGEQPYVVRMDWEDLRESVISVSCTCPHFSRGVRCKHVWAAIRMWATLPLANIPKSKREIQIVENENYDQLSFNEDDFFYDEQGPPQNARRLDSVIKAPPGDPQQERPPVPVFSPHTLKLSRAGVEGFHPFVIWQNAVDIGMFHRLQEALQNDLLRAAVVTRDISTGEPFPPFIIELALEDEADPEVTALAATYDAEGLSLNCRCRTAAMGPCTHLAHAMMILQFALTRAPIDYGYSDWRFRNRILKLQHLIHHADRPTQTPVALAMNGIVIDPEIRTAHKRRREFSAKGFSVIPKLPSLPHSFLTPAGFQEGLTWSESDDPIVRFFSQVRIQFSDKSEFSLHELFFHPYFHALPGQIKEALNTVFSEAKSRSKTVAASQTFLEMFDFQESDPDFDEDVGSADLEAIFQTLLTVQKASESKIQLWLEDEKRLPILSMNFAAPPAPEIEIATVGDELKINLAKNLTANHDEVMGTFAYDRQRQELSWDPNLQSLTALSFDLSRTPGSSFDSEPFQIAISSPEGMTRSLKFLQVENEQGNFELSYRSAPIIIAEPDCTLEIRVNSSGEFMPVLNVKFTDAKERRLLYFTEGQCRVLRGLHGGLADFIGSASTQLAVSAPGARRKNDLRVLKHRGAFLLIYIQTYLRIDSEAARNEKLSDFIDRVHRDVFELVFDEAAFDPTSCSKKIKSYIKQTIESLQDEIFSASVYFAHDGQLFFLGDYGKVLNRGLSALARVGLMKKSPADIFRARGSIFDPDRLALFLSRSLEVAGLSLHENAAALKFERFEPSDWFEGLSDLSAAGLSLFINDQPICEMAESDLRTEFLIDGKAMTLSTGRVDWFALHPKVFFRGKEVAWNSVRHQRSIAILEHEGRSYVVSRKQLPTLVHLQNFWEQLIESQKGRSRSTAFGVRDRYQLRRHQILDLLVLRLRGIDVKGDAGWEEVWQSFESLGKSRADLCLSLTLRATLKPYQLEGVQWLVDLEKLKMGAVLADDMGLGKTPQTLAFLQHLNNSRLRHTGRYLAVVPTSLTFNWISEAQKFTPDINTRFLHPTKFQGNLDPGLYVTTYGLVAEHPAYFQSRDWNVVVFDEAQNLKSFSTTRYKAAAEIRGDFKLALTGTPLENHLGELYAIIDLVLPGALGDYARFRKSFLTGQLVSTEEIERLRMIIKPILLRRTKEKILDELPPKIESVHLIPFEAQQRKIYRDIAVSWNERILSASKQKSDESLQLQMLTALMRLRQVCSDPGAIPGITYRKTPPKIEHLIEQVKEVVTEGHSVLIFTQFLHTLARVEALLREAQIALYTMSGSVPVQKRKDILAAFNGSTASAVLLMTLKTGGVGLNLTKASYVFHIEPWWNPAVENQATDRAHRLGQTRSVQVYRYIMKDSLEEKIQTLKAIKKSRFDMVFSEDIDELKKGDAQKSHLSREDFEYLLK